MPLKRQLAELAFIQNATEVRAACVRHSNAAMDAAIRGGLNVRIADAHGGAIHNVSVPVDSGDDAYEALSRAVENALGDEKTSDSGASSSPSSETKRASAAPRRRLCW